MIQNPNASIEIKQFFDQLKTDNKYWYEYTDKKVLIITEKPSQQKALKAVLPKNKHIKMISLAGHIMRLKNFEEYEPSLQDKSWFKMVNDKDIPFFPEDYEMIVKEKATGKFKTDYEDILLNVKRAAKDADIIVSCADPDNEGCALMLEAVLAAEQSHKILGQVDMSKLDFFSLQENIKKVDKIPFWEMAEAGFARTEFDWTFGLNNTILSSVVLGGGQTYHIGGVKSPVIKMVVDRMTHIKKFKPVKYWHFNGTAKHIATDAEFNFIVKVKQSDSEIKSVQSKIEKLEKNLEVLDKENPDHADEISNIYNELGKLRWQLNELVKEFESNERDIYSKQMRAKIEKSICVGDIVKVSNFTTKKDLTQNPPLAYSLTDLQAEAGSAHNYTPAKTLQTAQKLYEGQWQSYPRTDNRYYSSGEMANIKKIVPNLLGLKTFSNTVIPTPHKVKTGVFNSSKVSAHTGLAPTAKAIKDTSLSGEMKVIYDMVATRYLIQFMDKFEYYQVKLDVDIDAEVYITTFQNVQTKKGWRELYNPNNMYGFTYTEQQSLPNMLKGDELEILTIEKENLETKPKPMFTEFGLLKAMENISRIYPELEGLEKGIGTPATRASILDSLFKSKYLVKKGRVVAASDKAIKMMELLPENMTSPKLRADMEAQLNDIIDKKLTRTDYRVEVKDMVEFQTAQIFDIAKKHKIVAIDKATLPPSEAQLKFAKQMAKELKLKIPAGALKLKDEMTTWLKKHEKNMPIMLSEKQYAFIKEYGKDDENMVIILAAQDKKELTKEQKFAASKWLGSYMRTSEYQKKRAAKAAATRKRNREAKMKAMGIETPSVTIPKRKPRKPKKDS